MRFSYPIPKTDNDFEHLCCQLLKRHWGRPQLQRYAHSGEEQDGVDIHDPSQTKPIHAAQCKLHDYGKTIPPREIQEEVDKAKRHVPALRHYAILTTGRKSKQADKKVAEINRLHQEQGLFTVELLTWDQIEVLLDKFEDVRDPIYNTVSGQTVKLIAQRMAALHASIEASAQPSSDAIDLELEGVKAEVERHELKVAHRLAQRLEERHGEKLTPRQRWRLLSMRANILLGGGKPEQAGSLLLQAKPLQPEEEKAQVNEALGYELTGNQQKAHELAGTLCQKLPHSSAAIAIWVRTAPSTVGSAELEAKASQFADKECEVALALCISTLNQGDVDLAERHARRATELEPGLPQTWLMLGQAVHVKGAKEARRSLLEQAEAHYSKTVELAHSRGSAHIETAAYLNRGIVRDSLGVGSAEEDFRSARRLDPGDPAAMRGFALYLANHGKADQAVEEARAAAKAEPSDDSSVLLAAILWDRNRGNDRQQALVISLETVRRARQERYHEALEMCVLGLSEFKRWDEARALLESLAEGQVSEVERATHLGQIRMAQGDRTEAEVFARTALGAVGDGTTTADLRRLARLLALLGQHALALPLLQRIARPGRFDEDTRMLLACANVTHNHRVALDVCRTLREAGTGDRRLLDNEVDILP
jgi:tetratricopeptide (TPR) repeat protein